ncbi:CBS domain-containing protein [Nesterenkonia sandarakina]|nr:CBS domain-containing protein [Nesterenkonia sandarakina]
MTDIADIMAPLGATILGTRSLADAAQVLEESDPAVVLNLSYRAVGLITRADLHAVQQQDPQGWAKRRCVALARTDDHTVQRSTPIRELLVSSALDFSRPLLVLDEDQPAGILLPECISAWRREHQSIRAGRISPSGETR